MYTVPAAGSDMGTYGLQSGNFCHIACSGPEDGIQDHSKVYDVTRHASDILLAGVRETEQPVNDI